MPNTLQAGVAFYLMLLNQVDLRQVSAYGRQCQVDKHRHLHQAGLCEQQ